MEGRRGRKKSEVRGGEDERLTMGKRGRIGKEREGKEEEGGRG